VILTLGDIVSPLRTHSLMSAGASDEAALAASTKGSLMMLTVNSLVAKMFSRVSFGRAGDNLKDMLTSGGWCDTL
jgi:hypothetical protein